MITKSRLLLLSSLASMPAFAAPFLAIGDNAELFLTGRAEARYEDNITFAMDGPKKMEDFVFEGVPGAELIFGKNSLTSGSFSVEERLVGYSDHTGYNDNLGKVAFNSSYEGAKLTVLTKASFTEKNQNEKDVVGLIRRNVTNAGVTGELSISEKSKVGAAFLYDETDYRSTTGTVTLRDRQYYTVPLNYYFAISPKVDLSAGLQYQQTDVDVAAGDPSQDSSQMFYNVGARGEFTPKLSGTVRLGYAVRDQDGGENTGLFAVDAGLSYLYSLKTQFTLDLSNSFDTSSGGSGQKISSVTVGVRSTFSPGFTGVANVGYSKTDYIGANRKDDYIRGLLGVSYTVTQHLSVEANYTYLDNASDDPMSEFTANIITLAANFRY